MAKKQALSSPESKSTGNARPKRAAKAVTSSEATKKLPSAQKSMPSAPRGQARVLAQEEIGSVAGEVWQSLSEQGGESLAEIKKRIDAPADLVLAAIGWLAREEKLDFATSGRSVKISLR